VVFAATCANDATRAKPLDLIALAERAMEVD